MQGMADPYSGCDLSWIIDWMFYSLQHRSDLYEYEVMRPKNATSRNLQWHSGILLVVFCVELLYRRVCCVGDFEPLFEEGIDDMIIRFT